MNFDLEREFFRRKSTAGRLSLGMKQIGFTLEDTRRNLRVPEDKVFGETAIPPGTYEIVVSVSQHFGGKRLPEILRVPFFTGVRIHGGNTVKDSEGCILLAKNRIAPEMIQGAETVDFVALLDSVPGPHYITIHDTFRGVYLD